jgi:exonuclease SbcC
MDFDQFTRSMLLAQGGFAAFLQALPDERAPILEQIKGTEIYSKISIRVHERQREEREKLNLLQAETAGIVILEQEQEKDIQQELESKQKEELDLTRKLMDTDKAITWVKAVDGLKKEINNLTAEAGKLQADIEIFKPERDKLSRAIQAVSLDGSYATLTAIRIQHADEQKALKTGEAVLPELAFSAKEQAESLKSAEQQSTRAKAELEAALPLIRKIRSLDQTLADRKKAILKDEDSCRKGTIKIDADKQARLKEQEKRADAEKNLKVTEDYLKENAQDEWLISGLAGVEEQLDNLLSRQKEIAQKEAEKEKAVTALEQATKKLADCQKQCVTWKQELENASKNLRQGKDKLSQLLGDRLLREYRTEKETLLREMVFLKKIADIHLQKATFPFPMKSNRGLGCSLN